MQWCQHDYGILQNGRKTQPYKPHMLKNAWAQTERRAWLQNCSMQHILSSCHHGLRAKYSFAELSNTMLLDGIAPWRCSHTCDTEHDCPPVAEGTSFNTVQLRNPLCLTENSSSPRPPLTRSQGHGWVRRASLILAQRDHCTPSGKTDMWVTELGRGNTEMWELISLSLLFFFFLLPCKCCLWRLIVSEDWFSFV